MHPLDELCLRIAGMDRGNILHRRIGQRHPRRIAFFQGGVLPEKLPKRGGISNGRPYFGVFLQELCKCSQRHFILSQGIVQMPQHRNDADQECRQRLCAHDTAERLLLHRKLQIIVQFGKRFFGKRRREVIFKLFSVQMGKRLDIVQLVNDGPSRLLRFRKKLHIYIL